MCKRETDSDFLRRDQERDLHDLNEEHFQLLKDFAAVKVLLFKEQKEKESFERKYIDSSIELAGVKDKYIEMTEDIKKHDFEKNTLTGKIQSSENYIKSLEREIESYEM